MVSTIMKKDNITALVKKDLQYDLGHRDTKLTADQVFLHNS